jgi:hypothetical protein
MKTGVLTAMIFALMVGFPIAAMAGLAPDTDGDGVPDVLDNCSTVPNAAPFDCDTDSDGFGNACTSDFEPDNDTDITDFLSGLYPARQAMGPSRYDGDCDNDTDITDFLNMFYPRFQAMAPGNVPSGLSCAGTVACP